ncbi:MAG: hypothetical protein NVSMB9_00790 [Isosphaeraceae bacterium]
MALLRFLALGLLVTWFLTGSIVVSTEDPSNVRDEPLDQFLKKVDPEGAPTSVDKPSAPESPKRDTETPLADRPIGEVVEKDKALDSILEKLGETADSPSATDHLSGEKGHSTDQLPDVKSTKENLESKKKKDLDPLSESSKELDEHLETLTGKAKKNRQDPQDPAQGPLSDLIKQMREVEKRLEEPDTGDETRKKQVHIVKQIDTLIEQMRSSSSQSEGKSKKSLSMKPGKQPSQPSNSPGTTGGNAPSTKPQRRKERPSLAGGRESWGHLPPELRQEMENVFKEEALPSREEIIRRYYLSLSKKSILRRK